MAENPTRSKRILKVLGGIAALLVVALIVMYLYLDKEDTTLDDAARAQASGQFVNLSEGITHYELTGPEGAPVVVLVPGFSTPYYIWEPAVQALTEAGFRVLTYDLYGRGYSDRPQAAYDLEFYIAQLNDLITALNIEEPVHLVGLSMSGPIVAGFANRYPDHIRSLILIDPLIMPATQSITKVITIPLIGEYLTTTVLVPFILPPAQVEDFHRPERAPSDWVERYSEQMRYHGFRRAILNSMRNLIVKVDALSEYKAVGEQGLPTMLLWGAEDQTFPQSDIDRLLAAIPDIEFHLIADAGHLPYYEQPDVVNPLLIEFLNKHSGD